MSTSTTSNGIPPWDVAELPEPKPLGLRNWASFIGPGIVMMGIQIGGGEWLMGPSITAKYGGGLMWLATIAIIAQVFYNIECGRYALYCGEPIFTGFMRCAPGPGFWISVMVVMNAASLIPGLSSHGATMIASIYLDRPPTTADSWLIDPLAYGCLFAVALPVLIGGKVYNMLQAVMTAKVVIVLGFCLIMGVTCVSYTSWWNVFSGFVKFGNVPVENAEGKEVVVNAISHRLETGEWPLVSVASIVMLGSFAGYAGGGGLSNSTYSNFVRDKGWGMGMQVGAIPSAVSGRNVSLSHVGKIFDLTTDNLRRWKGWWKYILTDQVLVWAPGCFMGMALPALLSMQFAQYSTIPENTQVAQAIITSDGIRHAAMFPPVIAKVLWIIALFTGMMVMLPSQMAIVDDFSRRWTDAIWTANTRVRRTMKPHQVKWIYYSILGAYVLWSFLFAYLFRSAPRLMTDIIANLNNVALGLTSFQLLWINHTLIPKVLRPRWYHTSGVVMCGLFYLGLSILVFVFKIWPMMAAN
ncbi:MAG: Nramp family divalent metal transporter [Planctomycetes bacterium]|nr:Nramp family divalent metal transporter [Planctomycetota bacterium]